MLLRACNSVRDRVYFGFSSEEPAHAICPHLILGLTGVANAAWTRRLAGLRWRPGQYALLSARSNQFTKYYKPTPGLGVRRAPGRRKGESSGASHAAGG